MKVFVDTSALYSALDEADPNHQVALDLLDRLLGHAELVTHNYVHVEVEALVRRRLGASAAETLIDRLLPGMRTVWVDELLHGTALAAMGEERRGVSLVDQVSFLVMRRERIVDALAFDADFEAAGFRLPEVYGRRPGDHRLSETAAAYDADPSPEADLVGVAEIAARSGHSANTIQSWRRRHATFPAPAADLASGPVWRWAPVRSWIDARGPAARAPRAAP
jgi:predicted nucleic acid-binding protein